MLTAELAPIRQEGPSECHGFRVRVHNVTFLVGLVGFIISLANCTPMPTPTEIAANASEVAAKPPVFEVKSIPAITNDCRRVLVLKTELAYSEKAPLIKRIDVIFQAANTIVEVKPAEEVDVANFRVEFANTEPTAFGQPEVVTNGKTLVRPGDKLCVGAYMGAVSPDGSRMVPQSPMTVVGIQIPHFQ